MPGIAQHLRGKAGQLTERLAPCFERRAQVRRSSAELRHLRLPELLTCGEQPLERLALAPVELIGHPCGN